MSENGRRLLSMNGGRLRSGLFWGVLVLLGFTLNALILQKERVLASDRSMLLKLAPVDPRSLMQGDYMVLRYTMAREIPAEILERAPVDGTLVVRLDANRVATFVRFHQDEPLEAGEHLLRYRIRGGALQLGAESFFFQEGHAKQYEPAKYGELKVSPTGDSVLFGLRDEALNRLTPPGR